VKAHFAEVIESVRAGHEPLLVTQNGASAVVIQDHESYERMRDALLLFKLIALGERSLSKGKGIPHEKLFAAARSRLRSRAR
jgi:prevent-host-death family protein